LLEEEKEEDIEDAPDGVTVVGLLWEITHELLLLLIFLP